MKIQTDNLYQGNQRSLTDIAILYKRMSFNASDLLNHIDSGYLNQCKDRAKKVEMLKGQIKDAELQYTQVLTKIKGEKKQEPVSQNQITIPDSTKFNAFSYQFNPNAQRSGTVATPAKSNDKAADLAYPTLLGGSMGASTAVTSFAATTGTAATLGTAAASSTLYPDLNFSTNLTRNNTILSQSNSYQNPQPSSYSLGNPSYNQFQTSYNSSFQAPQGVYNQQSFYQQQSYQQYQPPVQNQNYYQPQPQGYQYNQMSYQQNYNMYQPSPQQYQQPITLAPDQSQPKPPVQNQQQFQNPITLPPTESNPAAYQTTLKNLNKQGQLRTIYCPLEIVESFIKIASANTNKKLETCAILAGSERNDALIIDTLIVPTQEGHQDHCFMTDEIQLFEAQIQHKVMTLGWIHTHPQYSLFLSSVDLHNQLGYQLQMPEAVAIVYSPIEKDRYKAFRVKDARASEIQKCNKSGFHEHKDNMGRPAYEECSHIVYVNAAQSNIRVKTEPMSSLNPKSFHSLTSVIGILCQASSSPESKFNFACTVLDERIISKSGNPSFFDQNTMNQFRSDQMGVGAFGDMSQPNIQNIHQLQGRVNQENQNPNMTLLSERQPANVNDLLQSKKGFHLAPIGDIVAHERSKLFTTNDRYMREEQLMRPLKSGGGPLGTTRIILEEKVELLHLNKEKTLTNDQIFEKLRIDGVYVDDPQIYQKFTDINMQKLEERILREKTFYDGVEQKLMPVKKTQYFKMNGEIKLQNDLLADEITRPADLAFETSEAYQVKEVNAILSNRLHSFKKRYYRLDIVVGKICVLKYPQLFCQEDKLAIELRELYKEYERRTSLAMIPFYMDRLKFIQDQQYLKSRNPLTPKDELEFLQKNVEETQRKLDQEKREVQEMAQKVYNKWKEIKLIRKENKFASTNVKMKVHKQPSISSAYDESSNNLENQGELYFNLMHEEPSGKLFDGTNLPSSELSRRNDITKVRAYVRLIINGKYVSRTKKVFMKWPNFEIEIGEQFQVCLFTMPSSIQLELVMGTFKETLVDVIDVEVPGKYVKALTSAASLVKEMEFSKFNYDKQRLARKGKQTISTHGEELDEKAKLKQAEELKKKEAEEQKAIENDLKGVLYIKAEWKGEGPEMPPMRSENIFKQQSAKKVRNTYDIDQQQRMLLRQLYIDVNDPRNEAIIKFIRETKNIFLIKLLQEDAKNPLSNLQPFRHLLLEARAKDPEMAKEVIPMLETEIIQNPQLLDKLEVLFREKAYREYLEKKVLEEKNNQQVSNSERVYVMELEENAVKYDAECIRRRQQFFDKLKQYQREIKAGHQKASTQYKSIVREFELLESENPLIALFNKMFITGRKLRPVVQKKQPVAIESCKEAKIMIHIIKGFNVPIRNTAYQDLKGTVQRPMQNPAQDPYNRSNVGPTAISMNQYGQSNFNRFGAQGFDQRQSLSAGFSRGFPQDGLRPNTTQRINGVSLNQPGNDPNMIVTKGDMRLLNEYQLKKIYQTPTVESFIEVRIVYNDEYQEVQITNVSLGAYPEWNEILAFPLVALNRKRFTKQELITTRSMIYITLFDREGDLYNSGRMQLEQQYRYLGSMSIPLISILNNPPKIDAVFRLNRPVVLNNYQVETDNFFYMNQNDNQVNDGDNRQVVTKEQPPTYISLSISLDPVLEIPQDSELEYYPGRESSGLLIAATEWVKALKKGKFEKREIKCLGENINGQSVLLCRYITPQAPPLDVFDPSVQNTQKQYAIQNAARYVSLIPLIEDNQAFIDFPDLFCNSQEFLDLGAGDYEEHAILLCNYFNYIDQHLGRPLIKSYVLFGVGFPEGKTAYVMRRDLENNHVELWNPMKGEAYFYGKEIVKEQVACIPISKGIKMEKKQSDPLCQLRNVGCIIGSDNIWANIQSFDHPSLVDYNLDDTSCWKPFFTKNNFKKFFPNEKIYSDQPPVLKYINPMEPQRAEVIAEKVTNFISERFEIERSQVNFMETRWKHDKDLKDSLQRILINCEIKKFITRQGATNSTLIKKEDQKSNIDNQFMAQNLDFRNTNGQRQWGFPINVTFVSLQALWEEVKNTKIHMIYDKEAEFALNVYIAPYSHNVFSVWFYILALTKDR